MFHELRELLKAPTLLALLSLAGCQTRPDEPSSDPRVGTSANRLEAEPPSPTPAEVAAARAEAAKPIEQQSAERNRTYNQAEAMALRTAIATQRMVLAQLKQARARQSDTNEATLDDEIELRERKIAEREAQLQLVESKAQPD